MWYNERVENKKGSRTPDDQSESSAPPTHKGAVLIITHPPPFGYPEKEEFLYARTVCEDVHDEAYW